VHKEILKENDWKKRKRIKQKEVIPQKAMGCEKVLAQEVY
jgi:hypothetical protein